MCNALKNGTHLNEGNQAIMGDKQVAATEDRRVWNQFS